MFSSLIEQNWKIKQNENKFTCASSESFEIMEIRKTLNKWKELLMQRDIWSDINKNHKSSRLWHKKYMVAHNYT